MQKCIPFLFHEADDCRIPGLQLLKEFISVEEENALLEFLKNEDSEIDWIVHTERRVAHFGVSFDYAVLSPYSRRKVSRVFPADKEC